MWEMDFLKNTLLELGDNNGGKDNNLKKLTLRYGVSTNTIGTQISIASHGAPAGRWKCEK